MGEPSVPDGRKFSPAQRDAVVGSLRGIAGQFDQAPPVMKWTGPQVAMLLNKMADLMGQDVGQTQSVVHRCPIDGAGTVVPCCGRTPFELPTTDRLAFDDADVTCQGGSVDNETGDGNA